MAQIKGEETLGLARDEVWHRLNDPGVLANSIPGCRGFEREDGQENRYRTSIAIAAGAVKGVYDGTVSYLDVVEPDRCTIKVEGKGDKGTISGSGEIELTKLDEGSTRIAYTGTFKLTGPVAGVGQRLAPGISRKMIVETLRNLEAGPTPGEQAGLGQVPDDVTVSNRPPAPAQARDDAFRPISVSPRLTFAGGLLLGLVLGLVIGLVI